MDSTSSSSPSASSSDVVVEQQEQQQQHQPESPMLVQSLSETSTSATMTPHTLTPEQEEEMKLRSKYPNPQKHSGSTFIQKMLNKGVRISFLI